jgi:hypothetical protein
MEIMRWILIPVSYVFAFESGVISAGGSLPEWQWLTHLLVGLGGFFAYTAKKINGD